MKIRSLPILAGAAALSAGLLVASPTAASAAAAPKASAAAATNWVQCWIYLETRFEDFDGPEQDGLISPADINAMAWLLPQDCREQLQGRFYIVDAIRGGAPDGLVSRADVLTLIQ